MKSLISLKINPSRDWKILVCFFALGLIVVSTFSLNVYLSRQIGGGYLDIEIIPVDNVVRIVDKNKLQSSITVLENRQTNFIKVKNSPTKIIDPSL